MAQRKETKKTIKVRDLKPKKDAKGGVVMNRPANNQISRNQNQGRNPKIAIESLQVVARICYEPHCCFDPVVKF